MLDDCFPATPVLSSSFLVCIGFLILTKTGGVGFAGKIELFRDMVSLITFSMSVLDETPTHILSQSP